MEHYYSDKDRDTAIKEIIPGHEIQIQFLFAIQKRNFESARELLKQLIKLYPDEQKYKNYQVLVGLKDLEDFCQVKNPDNYQSKSDQESQEEDFETVSEEDSEEDKSEQSASDASNESEKDTIQSIDSKTTSLSKTKGGVDDQGYTKEYWKDKYYEEFKINAIEQRVNSIPQLSKSSKNLIIQNELTQSTKNFKQNIYMPETAKSQLKGSKLSMAGSMSVKNLLIPSSMSIKNSQILSLVPGSQTNKYEFKKDVKIDEFKKDVKIDKIQTKKESKKQ